MTDQTLAKLRELLLNEFSEEELASLCQDIGINYDALPGAGSFGKTREIVEAARSQDKLRLLHSRLRELRPEAYAASGIVPAAAAATTTPTATAYQAPVPATAAAQAPNPRPQSSRNASALPFQALAVVLVVLLCAVVGLALLLPRLTTSTGPAPNPAANDPLAPAATAPVAGPTTINDSASTVTQALTDAAAASNVLAPVEPMTAAITSGSDSEQPPALVLTDTTAAQPVIVPTIAPVPVGPEAEAAVSPASVVTDTSGPVAAIRDLNEQLPAFYTGRATATDLENFWSGDALRSVVGFGNTRLPRAMRIQPAQRDALNVTYQYVRPPAVSNQSGVNAVVTSREAWRYANAVNGTEICEVRDYVYNLANDGARWQVQRFRSNLLETGCQPQ